MPLQAIIKYWPYVNIGFGHIAIEVRDGSRSEYISWAGSFNSELLDLKFYKTKPLEIKLPPIEVSYEEVEKRIQASQYYLTPQAKTYVELTHGNLDNAIFIDLKPHTRNELDAYGSKFNYFTNNCAHAIQEILYCSEYLPSFPAKKFGIRPYNVAQQVCNVGLRLLKQEEETLLADTRLDVWGKIPKCIELTLQSLELEKNKQLAKGIHEDVEQLNDEIKAIGLLPVYCKDELKLAKELLRALPSLEYAKGKILQCLRLIVLNEYFNHPFYFPLSVYRANVELQLEAIEDQAKRLERRGHLQAAKCASELAKDLHEKIADHLSPTNTDIEQFKKSAQPLINKARPVLETHRGWKLILGNLSLAIAGLGIGYLIAGVINKAVTGNFLFFRETATGQQLTSLQKKINFTPH